MENLEIENRNEFKIKTNILTNDIQYYLNIIEQIGDCYIVNAGILYFDKVAELEELYQNKNLKYFELKNDVLNKIIDCHLYTCAKYALSILKKIIESIKVFSRIPFGSKLFDMHLKKYLEEYAFVCNFISNFTIENNLNQAIHTYIKYTEIFGEEQLKINDMELLNEQLKKLGFSDMFVLVENPSTDEIKPKTKKLNFTKK